MRPTKFSQLLTYSSPEARLFPALGAHLKCVILFLLIVNFISMWGFRATVCRYVSRMGTPDKIDEVYLYKLRLDAASTSLGHVLRQGRSSSHRPEPTCYCPGSHHVDCR